MSVSAPAQETTTTQVATSGPTSSLPTGPIGITGLTGNQGLIGEEGPSISWDNPDSGLAITPAAAAAKLNFGVSVPAAAGAVQGMWISNSAYKSIVYRLEGPAGRLLLFREDAQTDQSGLAAEEAANAPRVNVPGVSLSMVHISGDPNDASAVVGPQVLSLVWLEGSVLETLIGETSNYTLDTLRAEAATVYGSARR